MPSTTFIQSYTAVKTLLAYATTVSGDTSVHRSTSIVGMGNEIRREKSWVNTPNYRVLRTTKGTLPDNSFSWQETSLSRTVGGFSTPRVWGGFGWSWRVVTYSFCVAVGVYSPAQRLTESTVNSRLIKKAKGNQWNVPVFLAEGRKTSTMVADRALHMARMVSALRRGRVDVFFASFHPTRQKTLSEREVKSFNRDFGRNPTGTAANWWLEHRYGWIPFMSDVRSAVNTLLDVSDMPANREATVRASLRTKFSENLLNDLVFADTTENFRLRGNFLREADERLRATWRLSVNPADIPGRFGLTNPAEIIWELLPFSFVADWFLPIGDYLSALDTNLRFNHLGGTYGRRLETTMTTVPLRAESPSHSWHSFSGRGKLIRVTRTRMMSAPSVSASSLSFSANLSSVRVISAVALLRQQLERLARR